MKHSFLLPLNLQFFSEEPPAEPTSAETPKTEEPTTPAPEEKTIPYDRFKKVNDDLKSFKQTFDALGLESVDSLKALVDDYNQRKVQEDERKRAEMSELEKLQADMKTLSDAKTGAETELESLQKALRNEKITNAFLKAAPSVGIPNDEKRLEAALKLFDVSAVNIEEGKVVGLEDALKSLVDQYSFLAGEEKKPQREIGEPSNSGTSDEAKTLEAQLEDAKKKKDFAKVIELSNKIQSLFK
jgi:hypothetical protein